jgi:hypothetical protein
MAMGFEQATIKVEREKEFQELKGAMEFALAPERAEKFLKAVKSAGLRIRDFDGLLAARVLKKLVPVLGAAGGAKQLYDALAVSDQAQIREFYLFRIEGIDAELRTKFHKLYQYY